MATRTDSLAQNLSADTPADPKVQFRKLETRVMKEIYRKLYPKSKTGYARIQSEALKPLAHILMAQTPGKCSCEHSYKMNATSPTTKEQKAFSQQYPITKENYKPPPPPKEEVMLREQLIKTRMVSLRDDILVLRQLGYQICICLCHYGHILCA